MYVCMFAILVGTHTLIHETFPTLILILLNAESAGSLGTRYLQLVIT